MVRQANNVGVRAYTYIVLLEKKGMKHSTVQLLNCSLLHLYWMTRVDDKGKGIKFKVAQEHLTERRSFDTEN
jgi:hypothetical protein